MSSSRICLCTLGTDAVWLMLAQAEAGSHDSR